MDPKFIRLKLQWHLRNDGVVADHADCHVGDRLTQMGSWEMNDFHGDLLSAG